MNKENFYWFKGKIRAFLPVYESVSSYFTNGSDHSNRQLIIISVLLQNLQFDGRACHNYNYDDDFAKCESILARLEDLSKYYNEYMENWAWDEASTWWSAAQHMSDEEA